MSSRERDPMPVTERMIDALHHTFGDNDLAVARRRLRLSTGDALVRWTEVVDRLESKRGWKRAG